jgi:hypothetical protein
LQSDNGIGRVPEEAGDSETDQYSSEREPQQQETDTGQSGGKG